MGKVCCAQCGKKAGQKDAYGFPIREEDMRSREILFQARNGDPEPGTILTCPDCTSKGFPWIRAEDSDDACFYTKGPGGRKVIGVNW